MANFTKFRNAKLTMEEAFTFDPSNFKTALGENLHIRLQVHLSLLNQFHLKFHLSHHLRLMKFH